MKRLRLYVADAMSSVGPPTYNFPAFEQHARTIRALGHDAVVPNEIDEFEGWVTVDRSALGGIITVKYTEKYSYEGVLGRDLEWVETCDGIVMGPLAEFSPGAQREKAHAEMLGLLVFESLAEVPRAEDLPNEELPTVQSNASAFQAALAAEIAAFEAHVRYPHADETVTWELHSDRKPGHGKLILDPECPKDTAYLINPDEVRIIDPTTGGAKGQKLQRFDLLPPDALAAVAKHFGLGARKYADRNWEKGYAWGLSYGAMQRHLHRFWAGEDMDDDPTLGEPSPHMAAAVFHGLALLAFQLRGIGTDDRGQA